jgi:hypothetical protein
MLFVVFRYGSQLLLPAPDGTRPVTTTSIEKETRAQQVLLASIPIESIPHHPYGSMCKARLRSRFET